jgi:hypothetical protein
MPSIGCASCTASRVHFHGYASLPWVCLLLPWNLFSILFVPCITLTPNTCCSCGTHLAMVRVPRCLQHRACVATRDLLCHNVPWCGALWDICRMTALNLEHQIFQVPSVEWALTAHCGLEPLKKCTGRGGLTLRPYLSCSVLCRQQVRSFGFA